MDAVRAALIALLSGLLRLPLAGGFLVRSGWPPGRAGGGGLARLCPQPSRPQSLRASAGDYIDADEVGPDGRPVADLLSGPRIDSEGRILNKKRKLYSYGSLEHVDDFFVGKYGVEWVVRGVKEKLRFRRREMASPPLRTSRFTFAGIGGFILRLWLDGLHHSAPGHLAISLIQQEHWRSLDSPLCISVGKFSKGPFFFRSSPYFDAITSFCPLDEAVERNTLRIGVSLATR